MNSVRTTVWILATVCMVAYSDVRNHAPPRDYHLDCVPTDTNKTSWVANLKEDHSTNTFQFVDLKALRQFVADLPDRSRIWYGFEEPPEMIHIGNQTWSTDAFRKYANYHGVLVSWRVGW
jgi:hypothetical protein